MSIIMLSLSYEKIWKKKRLSDNKILHLQEDIYIGKKYFLKSKVYIINLDFHIFWHMA